MLSAKTSGNDFDWLQINNMLPRTPEKEALAIGKRITRAFRKVEVEDAPLTISTGVAVKTGMEQDITAVLREAVNNLNQNKLTESRSGESDDP